MTEAEKVDMVHEIEVSIAEYSEENPDVNPGDVAHDITWSYTYGLAPADARDIKRRIGF